LLLAVAVPQPNRYSLLIGSDWNRHHTTTMQDLHRDEADPPDPPLYADDDEDSSPPSRWDDHPSLSAEERNSRFHCT
jgi:hypothetical protein